MSKKEFQSKKIVLLPLDERPCNRLYPGDLFNHRGLVNVVVPDKLGNKKNPADIKDIKAFLEKECKDADGLVVSIDMLLYGGLVPSRLHHIDKRVLLGRLNILKELREKFPKLLIYGFQVIMRCPDYSSDDEEPEYYNICGKEIHDLGVTVHQSRLESMGTQVGMAIGKIKSAYLEDYISRREINREMNEEALVFVQKEIIDVLVIPQDDSARFGYAALDQKDVRDKIDTLNLADRVLMYPGADEVGLTLVSRMINHFNGYKPKIYLKYACDLAKSIIPRYEGVSLSSTLKSHIFSAGCQECDSFNEADIVIFVTAPSEDMEEAFHQPSEKPGYIAERNFVEMMDVLRRSIDADKIVSIADNAYSNGGEIKLINILNNADLLMRVDGYAGWNTSANTIGTTIAQAVDSLVFGRTDEHNNFLAQRYVADVGYCSVARGKVTDALPDDMNYFDVHETCGKAAKMVDDTLKEFARTALSSISKHLEITNVNLPWSRMFEVDLIVKYK